MPDAADSNGRAPVETKWAEINATAAGDNTIVAAVAGMKIRVTALTFTCSAAANIAYKSGASVTKINAMPFAATGGLDSQRHAPNYFVETNTGDAFVMNLDGVYNVRGSLNYVLVS